MATFAQSCVLTDMGLVRTNNEDNVLELPGLVAVADGMGGHDDGEVASELALATLTEYADVLLGLADDKEKLMLAVEEIFQLAGDRISEASDKGNMGTTLVAAVLAPDGHTVYVAHIGDSRAYLHRDGALIPITNDHNVYNLLIEQGKTEEEAAAHPAREKLVQAVGFGFLNPDLAEVHLGRDDTLLLCSDGLCGVVSDERIAELMHEDLSVAAGWMIEEAKEVGGGPDNISVAMIRVKADESTTHVLDRRLERLREMFLFADLDEAELRNVSTFLQTRRFRDQDVIVQEGEVGEECMVFVQGKAHVYRGDLYLTEVGPGSHIGELALTGPWIRSATVLASGNVTVAVITREQFDNLSRSRPRLGLKISKALSFQVAKRLAQLTDRLAHVQLAITGHYDKE